MNLTAMGMTDGVGCMLVGAQEQDYEILGNIEWRKYYHSGTWQKNFPGAFMVYNWDQMGKLIPQNITMIMGHPECGQWSNLGFASLGKSQSRYEVPSDIQVFIDCVKRVKPEFFAMDNLVKSLYAVPLTKWNEELPEYDIFAEYISNYHYGNSQLCRKRMFIIGSKKKYEYVFQPNEKDHSNSVWDIIGELYGKDENDFFNHYQFPGETKSAYRDYYEKRYYTIDEAAEEFKKLRAGIAPRYLNDDGEEKNRIGMMKLYKDKHSHTLTGSNYHMHPESGKPLTCRERARIQGFPDSFEFVFAKESDHWNANMSKQTGKAMPIQFCRFLSKQFKNHINNISSPNTGDRFLRNDLIETSKITYCKEVGYSNQAQACKWCSIEDCPIRLESSQAKYQIKKSTPRQSRQTKEPKEWFSWN